jgi:hypothetical protein
MVLRVVALVVAMGLAVVFISSSAAAAGVVLRKVAVLVAVL